MKILNKKLIGSIIGIIFLALILKNIDINKSIESVKHLNLFFILLMFPCYFLSFIFRALRWKTILPENKTIKLSSCLNFMLRGWAVSCVVPARAGEIYRAYYFGLKENISRITVIASIVLERAFDGIILFSILLAMVSFVYSSKKLFFVSITAGLVFCGVFTVLLISSKFYKNNFIKKNFYTLILKISENNFIKKFLNEKLCEILSKIFKKITSAAISFMNGLDIFNSPFLMAKSFFYTVLIWLFEGLMIFFLIKSFGYSTGILGALFILSIIAFASLIPGGPASLGPFQWGYIIALNFFKIPNEISFAISIINQLFVMIFVFSGSLFFIAAEHFNLQEKIIYRSNKIIDK